MRKYSNGLHQQQRRPQLGYNRFGKSLVRLFKLTKSQQQADGGVMHDLRDVSVRLTLEGDFGASYLHGSNSKVIPTDTQKNTVYVVAKQWTSGQIELLALMLARHFLSQYEASHVSGVHIDIRETSWERIVVDGQPHRHAFSKKNSFIRFCRLFASRTDHVQLVSGISGLSLLKTTKSGFVGYWNDKFTTLPECTDRMMRTEAHVEWIYVDELRQSITDHVRSVCKEVAHNSSDALSRAVEVDFSDTFDKAVKIVTRQFVGEPIRGTMSWSLQQTLYDAGVQLLNELPALENVFLSMPNMHVYLFDLSRFDLDNNNEVWWPADEPHGVIEACVTREAAHVSAHDARKDKLLPYARI